MDETLKNIIEKYIIDFNQKKKEIGEYIVNNSIPVIWFGNIEKYNKSKRKIVTVAINPSLDEFPEKEKRFDEIDFANYEQTASDILLKNLENTLNNYFNNKPYKWFNSYEDILQGIGASYTELSRTGDVAIHIDVCTAIATKYLWSDKKLDKIRDKFIRYDLFQELIKYLNPDIVFFSASVDKFDVVKNCMNDLYEDDELILIREYCKDEPSEEEEKTNSFTLKINKKEDAATYLRAYKNNSNKYLFWGRNNSGMPFSVLNKDARNDVINGILTGKVITRKRTYQTEEIRKVVMFTHPGEEHPYTSGKNGKYEWNTEKHARKFMHVTGKYMDKQAYKYYEKCMKKSSKGKSDNAIEGNIAFWGEWEQPSNYRCLTDSPQKNYPQFVHTPICEKSNISEMLINGEDVLSTNFEDECINFYKKKQNTDPYVFGDKFMYCCCNQSRKKKNGEISDLPTKRLKKGDIIVFYSYQGKNDKYKCFIDTVFVVGGIIREGNYKDILPELKSNKYVSQQYFMGTLLPVCYGNQDEITGSENVLYYGATYEHPVDGMFSYFPCQKYKTGDLGYARYSCEAFEKNKEQGKKWFVTQNLGCDIYTKSDAVKFWNKLVKDVLEAGYLLGVHADEPEIE